MSNFSDYVTSTAFRLSLSGPQVQCLLQIEETGGSWLGHITFNALEAKGLTERYREGDRVGVRLTEAGRAVMPLLRLAGLTEIAKQQDAA